MAPNPATFAPGPALLLVVVKGVPSIGVHVIIGSSHWGTKTFSCGLSAFVVYNVPNVNSANADPNEHLKQAGVLGLAERRLGALCLCCFWVALLIAILALFTGRVWALGPV